MMMTVVSVPLPVDERLEIRKNRFCPPPMAETEKESVS